MNTQPEALRLADEFENGEWIAHTSQWREEAAAELRHLHALIAACEPYLKEGETPAERIERDHRDSLALMTLLAREKTKNEALLEACRTIVQAFDELPSGDPARMARLHINAARAAIAKAEGEKT